MLKDDSAKPIGVFDSGIGGLTVYRALRAALPQEDFIYLGDTARAPYGVKDQQTIERYSLAAARFLCEREIKFLVLACNTVSAQAVDALQRDRPGLSYCGVIAAGAEAAVKATRNKRVAILATEGTVRSGVYPDIIRSLKADITTEMLACNLLVALVEEGWCEGVEAEAIVDRYLSQLTSDYDTLVLGCTHFPMLADVFRRVCPPTASIVDSSTVTAHAVADLLQRRGLKNGQLQKGKDIFDVTDAPERFCLLGSRFLGRQIDVRQVRIDG